MKTVLLLMLVGSAVARADFSDGKVPEGANAYTAGTGALRLSLLGRSVVGLSAHTELETYLLLDAVLFPNLGLKVNVHDGPAFAAALDFDVGGGIYPIAAGGAIPLPGAVVGAGGFGIVTGAFQLVGVQTTFRPARRIALTARGNLAAVEAGTLDVIGGAGVGGGGGDAAAAPIAFGRSTTGGSIGAEMDVTLGHRNAIVAEWDLAKLRGVAGSDMLAMAFWIHAWRHFHLMLGAYAIIDLPDAKLLHDKMPVAPYVNLSWNL